MKPCHWLLVTACVCLAYPAIYALNLYSTFNPIIADQLVSGSFVASAAFLVAWTALEVLSRLPVRERTACRACGYDLSSQKCPECGARRDQRPS